MFNTFAKAAVRFINNPAETFNEAYNPHEREIFPAEGSRSLYCRDIMINGEYFKSKNKNNYYRIVPNNITLKELMENDRVFGIGEHNEFQPAPRLLEFIKRPSIPYKKSLKFGFDPETECLVKLEIENNKAYFVENYQAILAHAGARITIMRDIKTEDDLVAKLSAEHFEEVP